MTAALKSRVIRYASKPVPPAPMIPSGNKLNAPNSFSNPTVIAPTEVAAFFINCAAPPASTPTPSSVFPISAIPSITLVMAATISSLCSRTQSALLSIVSLRLVLYLVNASIDTSFMAEARRLNAASVVIWNILAALSDSPSTSCNVDSNFSYPSMFDIKAKTFFKATNPKNLVTSAALFV